MGNSGLQLTTGHLNDVPIPGAPYTFGVPADVQAQGDLEARETTGRRVTRVAPGADVPAAIERLAAESHRQVMRPL